jgi:hypothetical protein
MIVKNVLQFEEKKLSDIFELLGSLCEYIMRPLYRLLNPLNTQNKMATKKILSVALTLIVTSISIGQTSNDNALLKKKHLQYLTPRLEGRTAKMKILFGDLNGDGIKEAFIDWCIEASDKDRDAGGGNALMFLQCMEEGFAVYIKKGNDYVLLADKGKNYFTDEGFSFDAEKIENGKIICFNLSYADKDPRCCPSLKRTIYLVFKNNKIVKPEQTAKVTKQKS